MSGTQFSDYGIALPVNAMGQAYTTCPKCSQGRKKSNIKCLSIDVDREIWYCHHCGWTGGLESHVRMPKKSLKPKYVIPNPNGLEELTEEALKFFIGRGISEVTLKKNDVRFSQAVYFPQKESKAPALCFPYKRKNTIVNVKYRSRDKHFLQEKNAEKILYGLDDIEEHDTTLIITEGEIDKLSFNEIGYDFCVSVPDGAPSPKSKDFATKFEYIENCESELQHIKDFILAVDNDAAGKKLEQELARRLGYDKCFRVTYPADCKDPNDVLVKHGKKGLSSLIGSAKQFPVIGVNGVGDLHAELMRLYHHGFAATYETGWKSIDNYYKVRPGEMTILTGYTGHGKSEFLDALLVNLTRLHDWRFGVCSLENLPYERHVSKLVQKVIGKGLFHDTHDRMSEKELRSAANFLEDRFYFINPPKVDIDSILNAGRSLIFRKGIKGLVIDPYNELDHNRRVGVTETEYVSEFLSKVRRFARDNNIALWVVAHPTKPDRSMKVGAPTPYDISGSANWANKADNALSVFRTEKGNVEIHVRKIRFKEVGRIGVVELEYENISGRYLEMQSGWKALTKKAKKR